MTMWARWANWPFSVGDARRGPCGYGRKDLRRTRSRFRIVRYLVVEICDGDFEFTDVIFIIFWTQPCHRDLEIFFRCLLVGILVGEIWDYFDNSLIFWFCRAMGARADVTPAVDVTMVVL